MADVVAVVGAGITGLECAASLPAGIRPVVVDRIPVAGGVHGWDNDDTRAAAAAATACGAVLHLGETAVRWDGEELLVMGQDGARRIRARALVVAAGSRPLGRAELGLAGPRPAGILAATVACHLSETGLLVGRRPAVVGGGDWAARAIAELLHAGARHVEVISPDGRLRALPDGPAITLRTGVPVAVAGGARVSAVELEDGTRVECDALVLAHGLAPLRNVDGAVWEGARTVYAQPDADPMTVAAARAAGRAAARDVVQMLETA
jgi:pyruvate/2-oxoglutarate dehydrogenase complex dihydrolipoamide dehydrogenase (E3) component